MRILQIAPSFYPSIAGIETYSLNLSQGLAQHGHQVDVLTINTGNVATKEIIDGKIGVYRCSTFIRYRNLFVSIELVQRLIKAKDYDVYHIHVPFAFGMEAAVVASKLNHIPLVVTHHGEGAMGTPDILYSVMSKLYKIYLKFSRSVSMGYAERLIFLSQSYPESLRLGSKIRKKITVVKPGVDVQRFFPTGKGLSLRTAYGFGCEDKILLFVGVLDKSKRYKGVDYLLRAMRLVRDKSNDVKLIIVGGGELVPVLQELASELKLGPNVIFAGAMPNDKLPDYYDMSDIFVLPCITGGPESYSMVLVEAMASGKPCIASDIPGVRDALKNGHTGFLTPPKDVKALAAAILRLVQDDSLSRQMALHAQSEVGSHSWQKCAEEIEKVYIQVQQNG